MAAAALLGPATHPQMEMYMDADHAQPLSMRRHKRRRPPPSQRRPSEDGNKIGFDMKLDMAKERGRNDSGCFEDLSPAEVATLASPDVTVAHWQDVVAEWEERARAIVAQEVTRMKVMTEQKKRELGQASCPSERAAAAHSWRMEMAAMMDTTHDLMQCVANDLNEASVGSATSSLTPHELGQILEEELTQRASEQSQAPEIDNAKEKVYIVRTKRNRRRKRPNAASGSSSGSPPSSDGNILIDGEHWHEAKADSFTIHVAELRKPKPRRKKAPRMGPKTEAASRNFDWAEKSSSDKVVWRDDAHAPAQEPQQEDFFCDWIEMLKRSHININSDINQIFWNISFEPRKRRISHVLDNLPFDDHPDVFCDRCELLETTKKNLRREKRSRPQKCYWNIFSEWKRNLLEPSERKKKKKRYYAARKNNKKEAAIAAAPSHGHVTAKARPPKSALHDVMRIFDRKYHHSPKYPKAGVTEQPDLHRVKRKPPSAARPALPERRLRKVSSHDMEDFFRDFRHMFEERRPSLGRRRSRDERDPEDDDEVGQQRSAKRVRASNSNTALVAMKEDCAKPPISWEEMKRASERSVDLITKNIESKIREAFRAVGPNSLLCGDTTTAHREFLSLRDEVRAMRYHRKLDADRSDYSDIFQDSMWILDPESLLEQEDFFCDWMPNLQESAGPDGKRAVAHRTPKGGIKGLVRTDVHFAEEKALAEHRFTNAKYVMNCKNPFKAEKFHRNLMSKCMAKQPPMRSM